MPADLRPLIAHVAAAYGFSSVAAVSRLSGGAINQVFALRVDKCTVAGTDRPLVLRVHRAGYRSPVETRSELRFVAALQQRLDPAVSIPRPVSTTSGDLVIEIPDETGYSGQHCDLMTWVDGRELVPGGGFGPAAAYAIGAALAQVHNFSHDFVPPPDFILPRWDATMFGIDSPYRPATGPEGVLDGADLDLFYEIADRSNRVFVELDRQADATGIIHGDYILGNCLIRRRRSGCQVTALDFDDSGWGYYLYDLCPVLGNMAGYPGSINGNPGFPTLRRSYLAGYRSVRDLPIEWEAHIPLLMAARNANHCLWSSNPAWRMNLARRCLELN